MSFKVIGKSESDVTSIESRVTGSGKKNGTKPIQRNSANRTDRLRYS
jgi:hypothetical protein